MLISCAVTAQLICIFVFAYAKIRFSHNEAHIIASRQNRTSSYLSDCADVLAHLIFVVGIGPDGN